MRWEWINEGKKNLEASFLAPQGKSPAFSQDFYGSLRMEMAPQNEARRLDEPGTRDSSTFIMSHTAVEVPVMLKQIFKANKECAHLELFHQLIWSE